MGISLAALAAGTASAQATGPDFTGSTGVDARGTNNNPTAASTGTGNASFIFIRGDDNTATVTQNGNSNSSTITIGDEGALAFRNVAVHTQNSDQNRAVTDQNANDGRSTIIQGQVGDAGVVGRGRNFASVTQSANLASSTVEQYGLANTASVTQTGVAAASVVRQGRSFDFTDANNAPQAGTVSMANRNVVTVNQSGAGAQSEVYQSAFPGVNIQASDNSATVIQQGANTSFLAQGSRGNTALVAQRGGTLAAPNTSRIFQSDENSSGADTAASNPMSMNNAVASMGGIGNQSQIFQNGRRNRAENTMAGGGARNQGNTANLAGSQVAFTAVTSENAQAAAQTRTTTANNEPTAFEGNRSIIDQRGSDLGAFVVANNERGQNTRGRGNQSFVSQGNSALNVAPAQGQANNHVASVFQRGAVESSNIVQRNSAGGPVAYAAENNGRSRTENFGGGNEADFSGSADAAVRSAFMRQARAFAAVSTNGDGSTVLIDQTGDNQAAVTIGGGANVANNDFDSFNTAAIRQVDAGDFVVQGGDAGNPNNPVVNDQNARNAQATVFHQNLNGVQSLRNAARVDQGMGNAGSAFTNQFGSGGDDQAVGGPRFQAAQALGAAVNVTANVTQSGSRNDAVVTQDGSGLSATVVQRGTGGGAGTAAGDTAFGGGASLRNLVVVSQTGTNNTATATQNSGVGASGANGPRSGNTAAENVANGEPNVDDEYYFAGGARSAEIRILQTNTGNVAEATQSGLGQRARIEQSGARNLAGITQGSLAINATAVIRQFGNDNSFFITQNLGANQFNQAQYAVVTQTGNGNTGNTTIDAAGQPSGLTLTRPQ
jgi:hypothetical protein